jgi:predicted transcriptional regulator
MQILWKTKEGFVTDILDHFPDPRPAYNTVSTITRILVKKGFVGYRSYGKSHQYYPLIGKKEYTKTYMNRFVRNYFGNSFQEMVSFFTKEEKLSIKDLEEIRQIMSTEINKQKGK